MMDSLAKREQAYAQMNGSKEVRNPTGFHPLGRAVLVRPYEPKQKKASFIVIPDTVQDRHMMIEQRALVIEVGPEWVKDEAAPRCKPGDHVMISAMAGYAISKKDSLDGKTYRVVNHMDIFLRVEPGEGDGEDDEETSKESVPHTQV